MAELPEDWQGVFNVVGIPVVERDQNARLPRERPPLQHIDEPRLTDDPRVLGEPGHLSREILTTDCQPVDVVTDPRQHAVIEQDDGRGRKPPTPPGPSLRWKDRHGRTPDNFSYKSPHKDTHQMAAVVSRWLSQASFACSSRAGRLP